MIAPKQKNCFFWRHKKMERIKRFFADESASAEATSTVLLIGAVSIFLGAALLAWWTNVGGFFSTAGTSVGTLGTSSATGITNLHP
jgi:hypothetical protein